MKALVFKELRELRGIAAIALACYTALATSLMGAKVFDVVPGMPHGTNEVPFTGAAFVIPYFFVSAVFAMALGFRQSAVESSRGTFLYLLQRPLPRNEIMLIKLASGLGLFFVCASLPILAYALWAAAPGRLPGPFEWSMSASAWRTELAASILLPGAFLSGLRPASWFGTRLLPLTAAASVSLALLGNAWTWSLGIAVIVTIYAVLITSVCYVARERDYA